MQIARASALLFSLSVFACGDDGGGTKLIDSGIGNTDAAPKVCSAVSTIGSMQWDVTDESAGRYISFYADIGDINGEPAFLYYNFRRTMMTASLPATIDVTAGTENLDNSTCSTCFTILTFDPNATTLVVTHRYFQQSGTVNLTGGDPITMRGLMGNVSNLRLQEFEYDANDDFKFIPTGDCITLNATIDQDNVPNDWSCDVTDYYTGTTATPNPCDCECGAFDGDCFNPANPTPDCSGQTPVCWPSETEGVATECIAAQPNDTCQTAAAITLGTPVLGSLVGAQRHYSGGLQAATCTGYSQAGPDVVYKVNLTANTSYTATLSGTTTDLDGTIAIVGPSADGSVCTDMITTCIAGSDKTFAGQVETTTFTPAATGQYFIIVDSFYRDDYGEFTLEIKTP